MNPEFEALLAFAPPVLGEKAATDDHTTAPAGVTSPVSLLREAKALSDRGDMAGKNRILAGMVAADPRAFVVDSPAEKYPGLTHSQSGFQIHAHPGVAAQVAKPDTTLVDMLALNSSIQTDQDDRYKLAAVEKVAHYKQVCRKCDAVIVQCRCPGPVTDLTYGLCEGCGGEKEAAAPPAKPLPYRDRAEMYATDAAGNVFGGLYEHGGFGVFGGGIDPGEDAAAAAAREFAEESGWAVTNPRVLPFKPHTIDWRPPYSSPKQAERAKQFRGSRTYYVAGDLGEKIPDAKVDDLGRKDVRPYAIDEALRLAASDAVTDPVLVQANKNRKAVLEHLKALRAPAVKSAGFADAPVTVCVDFDGTLAKAQTPFDAKTAGRPRRRIVRLVRLLKEKGCRIIVWTVRDNARLLKRWLKENRVPYDFINENPDQPPDSSGKLYADVYLDDKAVNAQDADAAVRGVLDRVAPLLSERHTDGD